MQKLNLIQLIKYRNILDSYNPLAGSTYMPLPEPISHKRKSILNIENREDNRCLEWVLKAALERKLGVEHPNASRVTHYQKSSVQLNLDGVSFPTPVSEVSNNTLFPFFSKITLLFIFYVYFPSR